MKRGLNTSHSWKNEATQNLFDEHDMYGELIPAQHVNYTLAVATIDTISCHMV